MQETIHSLVRLSAAMTMFGVQQVQTVVSLARPQEAVERLGEVMNGMAAAVSANLDEANRPAVERISGLGRDVVSNASGMMRLTSEWLTRVVSPGAGTGTAGPAGR